MVHSTHCVLYSAVQCTIQYTMQCSVLYSVQCSVLYSVQCSVLYSIQYSAVYYPMPATPSDLAANLSGREGQVNGHIHILADCKRSIPLAEVGGGEEDRTGTDATISAWNCGKLSIFIFLKPHCTDVL